VRFEYAVIRVSDQALLASGHTVHASLDGALRPRRLPERVQHILKGSEASGVSA
jgi:acyl-CoA thioesterase FadM